MKLDSMSVSLANQKIYIKNEKSILKMKNSLPLVFVQYGTTSK